MWRPPFGVRALLFNFLHECLSESQFNKRVDLWNAQLVVGGAGELLQGPFAPAIPLNVESLQLIPHLTYSLIDHFGG
jgi:hypothetical protein